MTSTTPSERAGRLHARFTLLSERILAALDPSNGRHPGLATRRRLFTDAQTPICLDSHRDPATGLRQMNQWMRSAACHLGNGADLLAVWNQTVDRYGHDLPYAGEVNTTEFSRGVYREKVALAPKKRKRSRSAA